MNKTIFKRILVGFLTICLLLFNQTSLFSWGFYSHRKINRMAVFTLPPEMIGLFKKNIEDNKEIHKSSFSPESWINPKNANFSLTFSIDQNEKQ